MGLYETIIEYRTKEALEQGLALEKYLSAIIKVLETTDKGIKGGLSGQQLIIVFGYSTSFVQEYITLKINFKSFNLKLKKLRKKFFADYNLTKLQHDLIHLFLLEKFSIASICNILEVKEILVKKIQKESIQK